MERLTAEPATSSVTRIKRDLKVRLDVDVIVQAGLEVAGRPGASSVTVRELGKMLGADPTAIYRHFRNKQGLMQALVDRVLVLCQEGVTAPREDWRTRLEQFAASTLTVFAQYPAISVNAASLSTDGPGELGSVELILDALHVAGLSGDDLTRYYAILSSSMLAHASGHAHWHSDSENPTLEDRDWIVQSSPISAERYPNFAANQEKLLKLKSASIYLDGVSLILDTIEAQIAR
ncbi:MULTISPECIES: TetR/AcrR family transcriptional regulator [unclassified Leucobacter]|uniref:TetR/AcrR family transcriptional regulator n=1 Tax=unclassified Leucobacter TaxID=2621730 RepID=UPI00165DDA9B|nr:MULTISPECIES: TetR/AcrR family transcriptional regulator [unclassified Leucobacter]MBC9936225.1 helix-turn-helix transcriptional regulator [Leucobacter sp. cx-87]